VTECSGINPANNLHLDDVNRAVQSYNAIDYSERIRLTLSNVVRNTQEISLEEKLLEFRERFTTASEIIRARMLQEMDRGISMLIQEEQNINRIQDPPELSGRRRYTFGKGGPRRSTAAEIVEKELHKRDKEASRPQQHPERASTTPQQASDALTTSQRPGTPFIMTFSASGTIIRSPQRPRIREQAFSRSIINTTQDPEVVVLESWTTEALPNVPNSRSNAFSNHPIEASSRSQDSSQILIPRSQRQRKRPAYYDVELVQPLKRTRKQNRE